MIILCALFRRIVYHTCHFKLKKELIFPKDGYFLNEIQCRLEEEEVHISIQSFQQLYMYEVLLVTPLKSSPEHQGHDY